MAGFARQVIRDLKEAFTVKQINDNFMSLWMKIGGNLNYLDMADGFEKYLKGDKINIEANQVIIDAKESILLKAGQDSVDTLAGRVNDAELKITPEAITSTVRSSTEYTSDLSGKVSTTDYDLIVSMIEQTSDNVTISANNIDLVNSTTGGKAGETDPYIRINKGNMDFIESGGTTKVSIGHVLNGAVSEPLIVFGAGDLNGTNKGYIKKIDGALQIYFEGSGGSSMIELKADGLYIGGVKYATTTDTSGTLDDAKVYADAQDAINLISATTYTDAEVNNALSNITVTAKFG